MTTITDRRGWLSKLRGLFNRGPATTAERMARVKAEMDALLDRDPEQRFRAAQGEMSAMGKRALLRDPSDAKRDEIAKLLGCDDGQD